MTRRRTCRWFSSSGCPSPRPKLLLTDLELEFCILDSIPMALQSRRVLRWAQPNYSLTQSRTIQWFMDSTFGTFFFAIGVFHVTQSNKCAICVIAFRLYSERSSYTSTCVIEPHLVLCWLPGICRCSFAARVLALPQATDKKPPATVSFKNLRRCHKKNATCRNLLYSYPRRVKVIGLSQG